MGIWAEGRSERSRGGNGVTKGKSVACGDMCSHNDRKSSGGRHCGDRGVEDFLPTVWGEREETGESPRFRVNR